MTNKPPTYKFAIGPFLGGFDDPVADLGDISSRRTLERIDATYASAQVQAAFWCVALEVNEADGAVKFVDQLMV